MVSTEQNTSTETNPEVKEVKLVKRQREAKDRLDSLCDSVKRWQESGRKALIKICLLVAEAHRLSATHGNFTKWCTGVGFSRATAFRYVKAADAIVKLKERGVTESDMTRMDAKALYSMYDQPTGVYDRVAEEIGSGEMIHEGHITRWQREVRRGFLEMAGVEDDQPLPSVNGDEEYDDPWEVEAGVDEDQSLAVMGDVDDGSVMGRSFLEDMTSVHRKMGALAVHIKDVAAQLMDLAEGEYGGCLLPEARAAVHQLDTVSQTLMWCRPHGECPFCREHVRHDCPVCEGLGYVQRNTWERQSQSQREGAICVPAGVNSASVKNG